jgi:inosine/xanthosine triphosphate pyrophosphatase family protein
VYEKIKEALNVRVRREAAVERSKIQGKRMKAEIEAVNDNAVQNAVERARKLKEKKCIEDDVALIVCII